MTAFTNRCRVAATAALLLGALPAGAALDFVGNLSPAPGESQAIAFPSASGLSLNVQVFKSGVTDGAGAGAGINCTAYYGRVGDTPLAVPMFYAGDSGNNDRYSQIIPLAGFLPGNHGLGTWCSDDGGATREFNVGGDTIVAMTPAPTPPPGNAFVQLFEWKYTDVGQECAALAGSGYTGVQVSSPAEHRSHLTVGGNPWWVRYQPVSYLLESRSGTAQEFSDMVAACDAAGIDVIVDVVINHMSNAGAGALGTAGTFYFGLSYDYPGTHGPGNFHYCGTDPGGAQEHDMFNFADRYEVHNCELSGLADIDTTAAGPRALIVGYLQELIDLGVDGFRIDAAKHMRSSDIEDILGALTGSPYVVQEVPDSASEQVRGYEYFVNGDVTLFSYGYVVGAAFLNCGADLSNLNAILNNSDNTDDYLVFTANHDTQRQSGCVVSYQSGPGNDLANVFMLAAPYGYPRVMSGYYFGSTNQGPPATAGVTNDVWVNGEPSGCNATDWVCEHRRPALANTARLRMLAQGQPVTDQWDDGGQRIAFGRGDRGYVAINNAATAINRTWSTSMAAGTYCNLALYNATGNPAVCRYPDGVYPAPTSDLIQVDGNGDIPNYTLPGLTALTIHAEGQVVIADIDGDGVADDLDNRSEVSNPDQRDTDGDGFGNRCDADLNNDGVVNALDLGQLKLAFFGTPGAGNWNPDADFNGDDNVNTVDLGIMKTLFFGAPGPGALVPPQAPECGAPNTGLDPAAAFGDVMFMRGNMAGDWGAVIGFNDFTNLGNDQYLLEIQLSAGMFGYKVANAGWTIERSDIVDTLSDGGQVTLQDNGGGSPNSDLSVPASGCYSFTLDTTDTAMPVLSMDRKF